MNGAEADADLAAMRRLREGDDLALNEIMERWSPRVSGFLARQLGSDADALDLTQETFIAVYRARARYRPAAAFSTWVFGIASNLARQRLRWRKRHPEVSLDADGGGASPASAERDPAKCAENKERAEGVRAAVLSLPGDLREAVILSEYENLSHAEIAAVSGCSAKAVETRLYRARLQLRKVLGRWLER